MLLFIANILTGSSWNVFVCSIKNMMLIRSKYHENSSLNFEKKMPEWNASARLDASASVFRDKQNILWIQVCLDKSDLYNSESAATRTTFRRQNPACRLNCVSITRNPLQLGHFCYSRPVRVIETHLYFDNEIMFFYNENKYISELPNQYFGLKGSTAQQWLYIQNQINHFKGNFDPINITV